MLECGECPISPGLDKVCIGRANLRRATRKLVNACMAWGANRADIA